MSSPWLFFYSYLAPVIQHVINTMHKTVTHTLMESCCVEEFLPSAETEDIWGFTRAIEMVGGVSLVIFFSLCKGVDLKLSPRHANSQRDQLAALSSDILSQNTCWSRLDLLTPGDAEVKLKMQSCIKKPRSVSLHYLFSSVTPSSQRKTTNCEDSSEEVSPQVWWHHKWVWLPNTCILHSRLYNVGQ